MIDSMAIRGRLTACSTDSGSSIDDRASVYVQYLATDVGRVAGCQVDIGGCQLRWLTGPAHRRAAAEFGYLFRGKCRGYQRGPDGARRNAVDPNPPLRQVHGQRTGETDDGPLGGGIVDQHRVALVGCDGGGVDDGAAFGDVRQGRLGQQEHAEDIGAERLLPLFGGNIFELLLGVLLTRVVDQDVDPPPFSGHLLHHVLAEAFVGDVPCEGNHFAAGLADFLFGLARILMGVEVEQGDLGALPGEMHHDRPTDTAVCAGDHGNFALQFAAGPVLIGNEHRLRMHLLFGTRLFLLLRWWSLFLAHEALLSNQRKVAQLQPGLIRPRRSPIPEPAANGWY